MKKKANGQSGKPVTATEVARYAGVSQSAVSRFFTPGASISEKTRVKVEKAIGALGYRPNAIARSLITSQSRIIAVVLGYFSNPFYTQALARLCQELSKFGYGVLVFETNGRDAEPQIEKMLEYRVDGVLLLSANLTSELAARLQDNGIPTVLMNRRDLGGLSPSVVADNRKGGAAIARYLLSRGYRKFAYVAGLRSSSTNRDRQRGFISTLKELGHASPVVIRGEYDPAIACAAVAHLFETKTEPIDAMFVANDHMACAILDMLRFKLNLKVPRDIAVVGFDNIPTAAWPSYQLTTYSQPVEAMVDQSVDLLMARLKDPLHSLPTRVVPGELIVREST